MKKSLVLSSLLALALVLISALPVAAATDENLIPNADGTYHEIAAPGSGDHYDDIDDPVGTPDYWDTLINTTSATYQTDTFDIPDGSGLGTINSITVYSLVVKDLTDDAYSRACIYIGATLYTGTERTLTTSWVGYSDVWPTNPNTGYRWTWANITDLEIGVQLRAAGATSKAFCTQLYVTINYTDWSGIDKVMVINQTSIDSICGVEKQNIAKINGIDV